MEQDFYACTTLPQQGANILQIAEGHRNRPGAGASTIYEVPDGVSFVSVTWDGPQGASFGVRDNLTGARKDLGVIPPGPGSRMASAPVSVVGTGHGIQVFLDRIPTTGEMSHTGSISVIAQPIFGSGGGLLRGLLLLAGWAK